MGRVGPAPKLKSQSWRLFDQALNIAWCCRRALDRPADIEPFPDATLPDTGRLSSGCGSTCHSVM